MAAKCVKQKMKQGMSTGKAVSACYPKATKAAKSVIMSSLAGKGIKGIKKAMDVRAIKKSKPKKLIIRKTTSPIQKNKRRRKVKSIRKGY